MKKYYTVVVMLLSATIVVAQAKPKQKEKDKIPTQKEMADMMKEMQEAVDDMSPEDKKMMDTMGIKMPDTKSIQKNMSGISDAQLKKAYEDDSRIVPVKDPARINTALLTIISNDGMAAYIDKTHALVSSKLKPQSKTRAAEIYQSISQNNASSGSVGKTAVAIWMEGNPMLALYLLGNDCKKNPNADNLNNYAAILTMCGAEQLAIPLLNNLNKRYPQNSSIQNNIGQAWFGLGEIDKANKHLDSAIRIYAMHPQANFTKCLIEESKGNKTAAIAAAKRSIKNGYSSEKANKLKKLGYKLTSDDRAWDKPMPADALGLTKFKWPAYPKNVNESKALEEKWKLFKEECQNKINELNTVRVKLEQQMIAQQQLRTTKLLQAAQTGTVATLLPELAPKAIIKLASTVKGFEAVNNYVYAEALQPVVAAYEKTGELEKTEEQKMAALNSRYEDQFGEGKPNPFEAHCKDENAVRNELLQEANTMLEQRSRVYLNYSSSQTDKLLYYHQYTQWPDEFELTKVVAQISWLTQIRDQKIMFRDESSSCKAIPKKDTSKPGPLQHFDDVACKYVSTMNMGCYTITSQCSRLIGEFDCGGITINYKKDFETNRVSGSVFVGVSKSVSLGKGPFAPEAEATAAVGIEVDATGKTDLVGKVGANVNVAGQTVAGVEARAGINSGPSMSGKGLLEGIK
jgi:tetratricopeptide (TPR) repeat protein